MRLRYVLAGYRVATRAHFRDWQEQGLPGPHLLSLSDCVVDLVPVDPDGWDRWFASSQEAEIARDQAGRPELHVLGAGFAADDVPGLQDDMARDGWDGSLPERLIRREEFPGAGERRLGFELVGSTSRAGTPGPASGASSPTSTRPPASGRAPMG
ncbi:hypothetical protein ACGFI3_43815 [Nonomuraea wenchangensis]|uniref:hypothetical protein n=1 Tax=Nonomuraea wenchangensis TaxID=568860 RepID=UPI003710F676